MMVNEINFGKNLHWKCQTTVHALKTSAKTYLDKPRLTVLVLMHGVPINEITFNILVSNC